MSMNIITRTNRSVIGNRQERMVVVGGGDCHGHALTRCASRRPAPRGAAKRQPLLERLLKAASRALGYRPGLFGPMAAEMLGWASRRPALARSSATS